MNLPQQRRRPEPAGSRYKDIQVELTHMVFEGLMGTALIGCIGAVTATFFMALHFADPLMWWLGAGILFVCSFRIAMIYLFNSRPRPELTPESAALWELAFGILTVLYTATLALNTFYCFRYHDYGARSWVVIGTFAFCSGINGRSALRPWIAQASGLVMLIALGVSVLASDDLLVRCSIVSVVLYAVLYCTSIDSKFDTLVDKMRAQRQLASLAERDALTGLSNRRHFESQLERACALDAPFAILFIDLDKFKAVNDTYGHAIGDALLQEVASRLGQAVGQSDFIARLGGDEFAVLHASPATRKSAQALAERINHDMVQPFHIEGKQLRIAASIGIRLTTPSETDAPILLRSADSALYEVKRNGGSSFSFARPSASNSRHAIN